MRQSYKLKPTAPPSQVSLNLHTSMFQPNALRLCLPKVIWGCGTVRVRKDPVELSLTAFYLKLC